YNHGGLFHICGTGDIGFNATTTKLGKLFPGPVHSTPLNQKKKKNSPCHPHNTVAISEHPYACISIPTYCDAYQDRLRKQQDDPIVKKNEASAAALNRFIEDASLACKDIQAGLFLELFRVVLSIGFGLGTFWMVCWPTDDPKKAANRGLVCLIGIMITPMLVLINFIVALPYWEYIGVGYFDKTPETFMGPSAQIVVATAALDVVLQYCYLRWGTFYHGWKVRGMINSVPRITI
ncbi:hypothetical protein HDU96_001998, partial [Phlyctochytrium bullatum]